MSNINDFVIENGTLKKYTGTDAEVLVPDGVVEIARMTFSGCTCTRVVLPESIKVIGDSAFSRCVNLVELELPSGVASIGGAAFKGCNALCSVNIPEGVTSIQDWTFAECSSLKNIVLPNGLLSIGQKAFMKCVNLEKVVIPNGVVSIGELAFAGCENLTEVSLPDTLISVGCERGAFFDCKKIEYNEYDNAYYLGNDANQFAVLISAKDSGLSRCEIHQDTKLIGTPSFNACTNLAEINIPEGVISIGDNAFNGCVKIDHIDIPNSVVNIGNFAFYYCTNLKDIVIPDSVKTIGDSAFWNCYGLMSATIGVGVDEVGKKAFMAQTQFVMSDKFCRKENIQPQFIPYIVCSNAKDYAYVWVNQSGKKWDDWFAGKEFDANAVLEGIVELLLQKGEITKKEIKRATDFITKFNPTNGEEALNALSAKSTKK